MASIMSFNPIFILLLCCIHLQMASTGTIAPSASASRNIFAADMFKTVTNGRLQDNVIYSPASIQACLALAYLGAEGKTAQEMQSGLKLFGGDKQAVAESYGEFLASAFRGPGGGAKLKIANGIFVNDKLQVAPKFSDLAEKYFNTKATPLDFAKSDESVSHVNSWVERETNSKIKNLLQPGTLKADTSAVLVNAIYFKAKWTKRFSELATYKADFSLSPSQRVQVDMMSNGDKYKYGVLSDLDATVLEMPYENSDLTMLVLLPNQVDGLQDLEKKLRGVDLNDVAAKLKMHDVDVFLPKFKIEFEMDLVEPLKTLGMPTMFSNAADFSSLFTTQTPQKISEVRHKAYLEVNEVGSEAAAATFLKVVPMSLNMEQKTFNANHPFVFAIRNKDAVFFAGHVAKF